MLLILYDSYAFRVTHEIAVTESDSTISPAISWPAMDKFLEKKMNCFVNCLHFSLTWISLRNGAGEKTKDRAMIIPEDIPNAAKECK